MDISKFSGDYCDFCDYEKIKPCLSCIKIMYYEGIKDGIKESFSAIAIEEAIKEGIESAMPLSNFICESLKSGIMNSFPYPSEIKGCIYEGTKDGIKT